MGPSLSRRFVGSADKGRKHETGRGGALKPVLTVPERFRRAVQSFQSYRNRPKGFLARVDYWVYLPGEEMPGQEEIMHRMLAANPYAIRGVSPIGTAEAVYFSDVRVDFSLVRKDRNPRIFRSAVFPESLDPGLAQLSQVEESCALIKISFVSEQPVGDTRHTGFCVHAADAVAELAHGSVIYDRVAERLWTRPELAEALNRDFKGQDSDLHVATRWFGAAEGGWVETRGLRKIGLAEMKTAHMERDQQVLIRAVVELAVEKVWSAVKLDDEIMVTLFDDEFKVVSGKRGAEFNDVRILRLAEG
jgi:hypothetical protein